MLSQMIDAAIAAIPALFALFVVAREVGKVRRPIQRPAPMRPVAAPASESKPSPAPMPLTLPAPSPRPVPPLGTNYATQTVAALRKIAAAQGMPRAARSNREDLLQWLGRDASRYVRSLA